VKYKYADEPLVSKFRDRLAGSMRDGYSIGLASPHRKLQDTCAL
jgi:hypothetical protein